ncbi:hypothetical protein [Rhodococcus spongiicola]|nr:hypothetical protein [Rhodococcus spongiicola]
MKRSRFVVAAVLLTVGMGIISAPTAAAEDTGTGGLEWQPCSDRFRLPWEPATLTTDPVLSPFGTADIYCKSWHGVTAVYQLDPSGNRHELVRSLGAFEGAGSLVDLVGTEGAFDLYSPMGSIMLPLTLPLPFYVWDPATY